MPKLTLTIAQIENLIAVVEFLIPLNNDLLTYRLAHIRKDRTRSKDYPTKDNPACLLGWLPFIPHFKGRVEVPAHGFCHLDSMPTPLGWISAILFGDDCILDSMDCDETDTEKNYLLLKVADILENCSVKNS